MWNCFSLQTGFFPQQLQYEIVIFLLFKPSWNTPYGSNAVRCEVPHKKLITSTSTATTGVLRALLPVSITFSNQYTGTAKNLKPLSTTLFWHSVTYIL